MKLNSRNILLESLMGQSILAHCKPHYELTIQPHVYGVVIIFHIYLKCIATVQVVCYHFLVFIYSLMMARLY